ncbi:MAG: hypothetical protein ACLFM7_14200 [Bacteroidales bacterium]
MKCFKFTILVLVGFFPPVIYLPKKLYFKSSESYPATLDLTSVGKKPLKGTDMRCIDFGEYVIRNFQSQGVYYVRHEQLSLVKSLVPVPDQESSVFDGLE